MGTQLIGERTKVFNHPVYLMIESVDLGSIRYDAMELVKVVVK